MIPIPNVGLELPTRRSRVAHSGDPARRPFFCSSCQPDPLGASHGHCPLSLSQAAPRCFPILPQGTGQAGVSFLLSPYRGRSLPPPLFGDRPLRGCNPCIVTWLCVLAGCPHFGGRGDENPHFRASVPTLELRFPETGHDPEPHTDHCPVLLDSILRPLGTGTARGDPGVNLSVRAGVRLGSPRDRVSRVRPALPRAGGSQGLLLCRSLALNGPRAPCFPLHGQAVNHSEFLLGPRPLGRPQRTGSQAHSRAGPGANTSPR